MGFKIGKVDLSGKPVIMAEAGVNHLGRMDYAEKLIRTASIAGADIIKFQTYKAKKLTTKDAPRFWSWDGEASINGSQYDSYSLLDSFGKDQYKYVMDLCCKYGINFLSTPFDEDAVDMLVELGIEAFKIASCDITNLPFLRYVAKTKLPIMLSTGAAEIEEIDRAVEAIKNEGNNSICLMHCTLCYPTKNTDANLSAITHMQKHFPGIPIGLSDHTIGIDIPIASVLLGVKIIEKHFTFDKTLPLSADHWLSVDGDELRQIVQKSKIVYDAIGIGKKVRLECEELACTNARRSVVAKRDIMEGEIINDSMIICKRPGTGIPPFEIDKILGKKVKHEIAEDILLQWSDFE